MVVSILEYTMKTFLQSSRYVLKQPNGGHSSICPSAMNVWLYLEISTHSGGDNQ